MTDIIIASAAEIVTTLLVTLIGVLGAWLTLKLGKRVELTSINAAMQEVILLAQQTVEELQQTFVERVKAQREDGKLTEAEIKALGSMLLEQTKQKMSGPTIKLLEGAAVDINALIKSAGESYITKMKNEQVAILPGVLQYEEYDTEK